MTAFKQSDAQQQVKQKASQAKSAAQETGFVQRLSQAQEDVNSRVTSWKRLLGLHASSSNKCFKQGWIRCRDVANTLLLQT